MMSKIIGLFGDAEDAEKLLERLQEPQFQEIDIRTIEGEGGFGGATGAVFAAPGPASPGATGANAPAPLPVSFDEGLASAATDEAERRFFIDGVRGGGVLVEVESSEELAPQIRQLMVEHNGRVSGGRQEAE
jgi:hypothetical protein